MPCATADASVAPEADDDDEDASHLESTEPTSDAAVDPIDDAAVAALDAGQDPAFELDATFVEPDASVEADASVEPDAPAPTFMSFDDGLVGRCAVRPDHTLWCWGQGTWSSPTWQERRFPVQVGEHADWTSVSLGRETICGLRGSGSLWCFGQVFALGGLPPVRLEPSPVQIGTDADWKEVSVGMRRYLALKQDGTLWRWGTWLEVTASGIKALQIAEPTQVGTDADWAAVRAGLTVSCAIKTDGALHCLGYNGIGNVGNGTTTPAPDPTPVIGGGAWSSVAVASTACGVRDDGTLWCWGNKLGSSPVQMGEDTDWVEVAGHEDDLVGRRASGAIYSILSTLNGRLEVTPIDLTGNYVALSGHCGRRDDGTLWCWDSFTPRGDGSGNVEMSPVRIGTESDWVSTTNVLGLHEGGRVDASWAMPSLGQLSPVRELSGYGGNACAIREDNSLWCAGLNYSPKDSNGQSTFEPVQQGSDHDWLHIESLDQVWECAIRGSVATGQGSMWCRAPSNGPSWVQVGTTTDWTAVSLADRACGLRADGSLWCWKLSLGCCDGYRSATRISELAQLSTDHDWTAVSVGLFYKCGIRSGELWCTGQNDVGQLGIGSRVDAAGLVHVLPGSQWSAISAGSNWACGIQTDGSLWCWGDDTRGQLGLGSPGATRLTPQRVGAFSDWQALDTLDAGAVTCAIRQGELYCWGDNSAGLVTRQIRTLRPPVQVLSGPSSSGFCPFPIDEDHDGYASCGGDCNDGDSEVSPFAPELCNGIDDNCNQTIDEGCP